MSFAKAHLIELAKDFKNPKPNGKNIPVQFNPETLKVSYSNQLTDPKGGDKAAGTAGIQFSGAGTTKLALQLWFDVTAPMDGTGAGGQGAASSDVDDVSKLTQQLVYFMASPKERPKAGWTPPGVRFEWGTFSFDGVIDTIEESIEYFSPEGRPLRASVALTISKQSVLARDPDAARVDPPSRPGQVPLTAAQQGDSLQRMADAGGLPDWQSIAAANGIEDPLRVSPGQLINLSATLRSGSVATGVTGSIGARLSPSVPAGGGLNAALGGPVSGSLSFN